MKKRIKALSLWQPWASLVAEGHKTYETRSWQTNYRGWLAIHAARRWKRDQQEIMRRWPYNALPLPDPLPTGAIVAVARLVDVLPVELLGAGELDEIEHAVGNFADGRYAWQLTSVITLQKPLPVAGGQGLWWWDVPAFLIHKLEAREQFFLR